MAAVCASWVVVCVVVVVMVVLMILCDKSLFAMAKNGVCVVGIIGARGSFISAGLFQMAKSNGSCSVSDSLC